MEAELFEGLLFNRVSKNTFIDLNTTVADQETRLIVAEENIECSIISFNTYHVSIVLEQRTLDIIFIFSGLQMMDVELDERVIALEDDQNSKKTNICFKQLSFKKDFI